MKIGHVFQGRYNPIIVQKDVYLLELARYIVLNPVGIHYSSVSRIVKQTADAQFKTPNTPAVYLIVIHKRCITGL